MNILSESEVRQAARTGRRVLYSGKGALVTPAAWEAAAALGVDLREGTQPEFAVPVIDPTRAVQRVLWRRSPRWMTPAPRSSSAPRPLNKVAVVGAGMVGAATGLLACQRGIAKELVLIDIVPGLAAATALDLEHSAGITGSTTRVHGGTSMELVEGADVVVVTAGRPRSPGMSRSDLASVNSRVVRSVGEEIGRSAPGAVGIAVSNPVDEMTHVLWESSGLPGRQIIGMAGTLDGSRFRAGLATAAGVGAADVSAFTIGSHGAEMVPVTSAARIKGRPVDEVLTPTALADVVSQTVNGGAEVVALRKTGSASIAPAHAIIELIETMTGHRVGPVSVTARLEGEYGLDGVYVGVRAILGRDGVESVVEDRLDDSEREHFLTAAASIRSRLDAMP